MYYIQSRSILYNTYKCFHEFEKRLFKIIEIIRKSKIIRTAFEVLFYTNTSHE